MDDRALTVTQLNDYVAGLMTYDPVLRNVCVCGEISNYKIAASGNSYFSLKDENSLIRCIMFRSHALENAVVLEDGMRVNVYGYASLYAKEGNYQFYAHKIQCKGTGQWQELFEKLKEKLCAQGYFAPERKRALPECPRRIGIVTSASGAVIHDITQVAWRLAPVPMLLCPVKVQGEGAAQEISEAIHKLNSVYDIDVIIVARGGGSIEDLWAFNEEVVADAVYKSAAPVVSAVGHETDFTIIDYVADVRAPTPSAAAEIIASSLSRNRLRLERCERAMQKIASDIIKREQNALKWNLRVLYQVSPQNTLKIDRQKLDNILNRMCNSLSKNIDISKNALFHLERRLESASPLSVLKRGYAIISEDGTEVKSIHNVSKGMTLSIRLHDGSIIASVVEVLNEKVIQEERPYA